MVDRRVTQGTRGETGQWWCERAWTVVATCAKQGRSAFAFFREALRAYVNGTPAPSLLQIRERLRLINTIIPEDV